MNRTAQIEEVRARLAEQKASTPQGRIAAAQAAKPEPKGLTPHLAALLAFAAHEHTAKVQGLA